MFGIGSTELLVILVVALIVLGPKNLPKIAQTLGKALGQFQRVSKDFQRTLNTEIALEEESDKKKEQERLIAEQVARQVAKKEQEQKMTQDSDNLASPVLSANNTESTTKETPIDPTHNTPTQINEASLQKKIDENVG